MDQLCMDALARWKATLPKQDRLILISHHLDGLTPAEVAAVLDLSEGYVLRRLHHLQQDLLQTVRRGSLSRGWTRKP